MKVLIFSIQNDYSTSEIIKYLINFRADILRINSDENRFQLLVVDEDKILVNDLLNGTTINLLDYKSYWYRRGGISKSFLGIQDYDVILDKTAHFESAGIKAALKKSMSEEYKSLTHYLMNRIEKNAVIRLSSYFNSRLNRLEVLETAKENGFKIPPYHIFSNLFQIQQLIESTKARYVSKSIEDGLHFTDDTDAYYSYTERLNPKELVCEKHVSIFPSLVMKEISKKMELRVFYFDDEFYSMAIFSQSNKQTEVDFRKYSRQKPNRTEPFKLPEAIAKKLKKVFKHYGLNTGSADLIVNTNDEYVFLEINPVGQFGMVSNPCNYALEQKIANYLVHGKS